MSDPVPAVVNHYVIGASVTVTGTYTNHQTGAPTDPSDAKVDVVDPKGHTNTYVWNGGSGTVVKVSTGVFTYAIDASTLVGTWQYRWWSPPGSSVQTAGSWKFIIDPFPSR